MLRNRPTSRFETVCAAGLIAALLLLVSPLARAGESAIDLDGNPLNGAESRVVTRVLQTYPVQIENVVYNNATGESFTFVWPGAGPGGFDSYVTPGPSVGTKWEWTTVSQVYSIQSPVTFRKSLRGLPSFGAAPGGIQAGGTPGFFSVPGKSIYPTSVTVSSASLTSSLITFFSPEKQIASCGGTFTPGRFEQTITNSSPNPVTVMVEQPDCCPEPQMLLCEDGCQFYRTDPLNCGGCGVQCGADEYCADGACTPVCPEGQTLCGETCVDLQHDPQHCGACDNACSVNSICDKGECFACESTEPIACDNHCVNLKDDPANCGGCGNVCDFSACPLPGSGACHDGDCVCESAPVASPLAFEPSAGRPRAAAGGARRGAALAAPRRAIRTPSAGVAALGSPEGQKSVVQEAPVCDLAPLQQTIPAGGSFTQCQSGALVGKEIFTTATIESGGRVIGGGPCAVIVPANELEIPPFLPSPAGVVLQDTSGDGLCQPGEMCSLFLSVQNLGPSPLTGPVGRLSSPPDSFNPLEVTFLGDSSGYPDFPGFAGGGDCETAPQLDPKQNFVAFSFRLPDAQEGDVGRVFNLNLANPDGGQPGVDMPFVLGIGAACDPAHLDGKTFDGLAGLLEPVDARLVPEGDPVQYSAGSFSINKTLPRKLTLLCGTQELSSAEIALAPQIVRLVHETLGPQPLENINGANGANPSDPFFACGESRCEYQLRTRDLPLGAFVISIKMPDSRVFQAGFTIRP